MPGRIKTAIFWGALTLAVTLGFTAAAPASTAPNVGWTELLPPAPSPNEPQPGPLPRCRKATIRCVNVQIRRMKHLRDRLGCDHRAVFATTYMMLTRQIRKTVVNQPRFFQYPRYLFREVAGFANVYFDTFHAWAAGKRVPGAWRIAFETARSGDVNGAQDMLLGINAHVQHDMPFVIAALGVRARSGASRKIDHDRVNEVLNRAYDPVVHAIEKRYDDRVALTNSDLTPLDDIGGLEAVRGWREGVWRNAERLVNAADKAERAQIASQIEANSVLWATLIKSAETPGDRERRDAYCQAQLGG
jgi:hypothetical protein